MKYATWELNFTDPKYGTGPEDSVNAQGGTAEGAYSSGEITAGGKILGYFTGDPKNLSAWNFTKLTQQKALDFVLAINDQAYLQDDGRIAIPLEDSRI